jgi:uncharacterized membrane protein YedE/YeeE
MKQLLSALFAGLLFGLGLILSGMTNPAKVIGFLDVSGNFDPSLGLVMAGALAVAAIAFRLKGRPAPGPRTIDRPLVLGSLTFGIGWGLAGFCPGPALASLATGAREPLIFGAAMLAGMALFSLLEALRDRKA